MHIPTAGRDRKIHKLQLANSLSQQRACKMDFTNSLTLNMTPQMKVPQILGKPDVCCQRFAENSQWDESKQHTLSPSLFRRAPRKRVEGQMFRGLGRALGRWKAKHKTEDPMQTRLTVGSIRECSDIHSAAPRNQKT